MSLVAKYMTPAEIWRGGVFADGFASKRDIVANGGVITGAPRICDGVVLDGTNDYITYRLNGNEITDDGDTVVFEFWPEFNWDEDVIRYLYTSNNPNILYVAKRDLASNHILRIVAGGVAVADIPSATYSPYWKVNQRNVLVVKTLTGDTSAWLNGFEILSNDTTSFSVPVIPTDIVIGARQDGALPFKGKITNFKLFNSQLEAQEAIDYYTLQTFNYMDKAEVILPMSACQHKPEQSRTLDVSREANHGSFGAGAAEPIKLALRGYQTDGGDYIKTGIMPVVTGQNITSVCKYKLSAITGSYGIYQWSTDSSVNSFLLLHSGSADKLYYFVRTPNEPQAAIFAGIKRNNLSGIVAIGRYDSTNTSMWANGRMANNASNPLAPIADSTAIMSFFVRPNLVSNPMPANSEINFAGLWRRALSVTQILDLTTRLMNEVFNV